MVPPFSCEEPHMPKINVGSVATTALAVFAGLYAYDLLKSKLPTL